MYYNLHPITKLIAQGEGGQLDFKKTIPSAKKVARTLAAFANGQGGRLLVGVRDNGSIAGCHPEEEMHLVDLAARVYCQPAVVCSYETHLYKGLQVLEVMVHPSDQKPHQAIVEEEGDKWRIYIRVGDQVLLASPLMATVLRRAASQQGTLIRYTEREHTLLQYLAQHGRLTLAQATELLHTNRHQATQLLVNLVCARVLHLHTTPKDEFFTLVA